MPWTSSATTGRRRATLARRSRIDPGVTGGVKSAEGWFQFDFDPFSVLEEVVASGCVPDQRAHQFYRRPPHSRPVPSSLRKSVPGPVPEPSAGTGNLADLMPRTERSASRPQLRCEVLRAKGHEVEQGDFLSFARGGFDRIVMNPPFDQGRWRASSTPSGSWRRAGAGGDFAGRCSQEVGPGLRCCWHGPYDNQFPGTSASVVVLVVEAVQS